MLCFSTSSEDVRGKSWYFGPISRSDCDVLMAERGQDGDFLVRDSESNVSIDHTKPFCTTQYNFRLVTSLCH